MNTQKKSIFRFEILSWDWISYLSCFVNLFCIALMEKKVLGHKVHLLFSSVNSSFDLLSAQGILLGSISPPFTSSFYSCTYPKSAKQLFVLLGSVCLKGARKNVNEIDPWRESWQIKWRNLLTRLTQHKNDNNNSKGTPFDDIFERVGRKMFFVLLKIKFNFKGKKKDHSNISYATLFKMHNSLCKTLSTVDVWASNYKLECLKSKFLYLLTLSIKQCFITRKTYWWDWLPLSIQ